jgi:hypothetical protein
VGHVGSTHPLIHVRRGLMGRLDQPQELTQNPNDDSKTHTHSFFSEEHTHSIFELLVPQELTQNPNDDQKHILTLFLSYWYRCFLILVQM